MDTIDEVEVIHCIACNTELNGNTDTHTTRDDDPVCNDCRVMCECCEDILSTDDEFNSVESELWCQNCTENNANWCDTGDHYFRGECYSTDDSNDTMCERCYEDNTTYCEDCDSTYMHG